MPDGEIIEDDIIFGKVKRIELKDGEVAGVEIKPKMNFDLGKGNGRSVKEEVSGGSVGLIIDGRGRPIVFPSSEERLDRILEWYTTLDVYPKDLLEGLRGRN